MQRSAVQKRVQAGWKNLKGQNEQSAKISKQNQLAKKSKGQKKNTQNENIKKFRKEVITDTSLSTSNTNLNLLPIVLQKQAAKSKLPNSNLSIAKIMNLNCKITPIMPAKSAIII